MPRFGHCLLSALLASVALLCAPAPAHAGGVPPAVYAGMHWRLDGPFRGGWATVARGVPGHPNTYYFGSAGGGVWKTMDAGRTWHPLTSHQPFASIGALAVAPSAPKTVYIGTGQVAPRYDIAGGNGVYKSTDGGRTWQHLGLADARHIGAILVDAHDADTVIVAAQGHMFGPNKQRGIYRSSDGGRTWHHVLSINDRTGVVDLARDPAHPDHIYAAAWQTRSWPWMSYFTPKAGPGSGIYESTDDGRHWHRLDGPGWPKGDVGRIGLAVTDTARGTRIYASLDAGKAGGIYRSDDGGAHWKHVNDNAGTFGDWYFSRLTADPRNPDTVYSTGQSIRRSTDGGRTWTEIKGAPGGDDYHDLWINPQQPDHMITASDQGCVISVDGGRTWSSWYNQPTGQFYHLATDNRFPYWIYSGQQDSGTVGIASRSDYGSITFRDWHPVGGDERDYDVPDPVDPAIVYGSGLGGRVSRYDAHTGQVQNVSPWPVGSYGARPTTVKYRYTWITPLVAQQIAPHAIFVGAQKLFRSTDQGRHWSIVSPDLTGADPHAKHCDGKVGEDRATACGFGVIYSIGLSPRDAKEIWVGTDNGLVQVTRDGGRHWTNVTPKAVPHWARIDSIDVSALQPGVAYVAVDDHRNGDIRPLLLRTSDYGKHWTAIDNGLPKHQFTTVLRADPKQAGLLYAGTNHGVYVSFDNGGHWQPLQNNLPTAWVRDLAVHDDDLIAATQGRAIWILDDVTPLRQIRDGFSGHSAYLFNPARALRVHPDNNRDTPLPPETPVGKNPPAGAVIDYWLGHPAHGPVTLTIRDGQGHLVHRFSSTETHRDLPAERYFEKDWLRPAKPLSTAAGMHRVVWNLRWPRPDAVRYSYSIAAVFGEDTPLTPQGPYVVPGSYKVTLDVDGHRYSAPLQVAEDPRVHTSQAGLETLLAFQRKVGDSMERAYRGYARRQALEHALESREDKLTSASLKTRAADLHKALHQLAGSHDSFARLSGIVTSLETDTEDADVPPTAAQRAVLQDANQRLDSAEQAWKALLKGPLARLNQGLSKAGMKVVQVPPDTALHIHAEPEGQDLP